MNRAEIRDEVYDRLGVTSADALFPSDVVERLINVALHLIEVEKPWPWLEAVTTFTTTAGTATYDVPDDWLKTRSLKIDTHETMDRLSIRDLEDSFPDASRSDLPRYYAVDSDQLVLGPIPDAVYTVKHRYTVREPDLYDDGDTPLMPASFHGAIAELAAYEGLRRAREEPRAQIALQAYQGWQARMADDNTRTTANPRIRLKLARRR